MLNRAWRLTGGLWGPSGYLWLSWVLFGILWGLLVPAEPHLVQLLLALPQPLVHALFQGLHLAQRKGRYQRGPMAQIRAGMGMLFISFFVFLFLLFWNSLRRPGWPLTE